MRFALEYEKQSFMSKKPITFTNIIISTINNP